MAPAGDQLLRLHEEFRSRGCRAPELDVVALDGDFVVALVGGHLPLHRMHVGDAPRNRDYLRQMNGDTSRRNVSPAARSPAQGRALIMAARSQFCPVLS